LFSGNVEQQSPFPSRGPRIATWVPKGFWQMERRKEVRDDPGSSKIGTPGPGEGSRGRPSGGVRDLEGLVIAIPSLIVGGSQFQPVLVFPDLELDGVG
jgi:hypothetical protein